MPLSDSARRVLETAVGLNPDGARQLVAILRTAPAAVKYKPQDRFGPLGIMVGESGVANAARGFSRPQLPLEHHGAAERFRREWLAKGFTKAELADALESCLRALGEQSAPHTGSWLAFRRDPIAPDVLSRIFGPVSDRHS
ncbi:MAG TPA: hypothetical protein VF160_10870 [Candidatus Dormibacteraeota bacterium]